LPRSHAGSSIDPDAFDESGNLWVDGNGFVRVQLTGHRQDHVDGLLDDVDNIDRLRTRLGSGRFALRRRATAAADEIDRQKHHGHRLEPH
jgi:hypothetical protein